MKLLKRMLSRPVVLEHRSARLTFFLLLALLHAVGFADMAQASTSSSVMVDVTQHIQQELQAKAPGFKVSSTKAVSLLDAMLVQQYGARGHLMTEPDATLKPVFYQAAALLMNGYPIAGGTLVNVLRQDAAMSRSPSGPALSAFVDAMLSPTGEDDVELLAYQHKTMTISQHISQLPADMQLPAQVMLLGEVYDDAIAARAGRQVYEAAHPTAEQEAMVESARQAARAIPVPAMASEDN